MECPLGETLLAVLDFAPWGEIGAAGLEALAAANSCVIAQLGGYKGVVYGLDAAIGLLSRAASAMQDLSPAARSPPPVLQCAVQPPLLLLGATRSVGPPLWWDQRGERFVAEVQEGHWRRLSPRVAAEAAAQGGWAIVNSAVTAATPGVLGVFGMVHVNGTPRQVPPSLPHMHALITFGSGPQYGPRWVPCLAGCVVQLLRELRPDSPMLLRQRSDLPMVRQQLMSAASARCPPGRTCAPVAAAQPQKVTLLRELPAVNLGAFGHMLQSALQRGMSIVVDTRFVLSHPLAQVVAGVSLAEPGDAWTWGVQPELVPREADVWWQRGALLSILCGPVCITVHAELNAVVLTAGEPCRRNAKPRQFEVPSWPPAPRSATAPPHGPALAQHLSKELGAVQREREYLRWYLDRSTPEQALQRATAAGRASLGPGLGPYKCTGSVLGSGEGGTVYEVADPRGHAWALKVLPLRVATDYPAVSEIALTGIANGHPHIAGLVDLVCAADVEGIPAQDLSALLHAHPPLAGEPVAAYGHAAEIVSVTGGGAIVRYATTGAEQFVPWSGLTRFSAKATSVGIVMERYNAGSLMAHGTLPAPDRERLLVHIAGALRYLRAKGFSHCDVHPGNILLASEAEGRHRFVLADLGRCQPASPATVDLDCWCLGMCGGIASGVRTGESGELAPGFVPWGLLFTVSPEVYRCVQNALPPDGEVSAVIVSLLAGPMGRETNSGGVDPDPLRAVDRLITTQAPREAALLSTSNIVPPSDRTAAASGEHGVASGDSLDEGIAGKW
eukprot:TRINITY_DN14248_c0_g2_i1.p1 TRINITY_DN14248_c0_g2~~TRINITY_DN14248_c0_g2_i1.p1  ORF type:complete len:821 (+),score=179.05 TRINITY_DN14248_c0_g2_i1:109-2463(+)